MAKSYLNLGNPSGTVNSMSFYRVSDAQPNWAQTDPSQPDYISNKNLAELPIIVDGEEFTQHENDAMEPIEFRSGKNVHLETSIEEYPGTNGSRYKNIITINADGVDGSSEREISINGKEVKGNINFEQGKGIQLITVPGQDSVTIRVASTEEIPQQREFSIDGQLVEGNIEFISGEGIQLSNAGNGKITINSTSMDKDTVRPVYVNGKQVLDESVSSGGLKLIGGKNIDLVYENGAIVISGSGSGGSEPGTGGDCECPEIIAGEGIQITDYTAYGQKVISLEKDFITDEYVKSISTKKLTQEQGLTLVLNGGNAHG